MGVEKGANWLLEEIRKKSEEKADYNQNYYDTWKERRKCDSESYDHRVSRFVEEREYEGVYRRIQQTAGQAISAIPSVLFRVRYTLYLASVFEPRICQQLSLFS